MIKPFHLLPLKLAAGAVLITSKCLLAADMKDGTELSATTPAFEAVSITNSFKDYYRENELSVDGFGLAAYGESTVDQSGSRIRHHTLLGAGAGVNYFFTRNIGVGADMGSENTTGPFIDNAAANLIWRLPLGRKGLAPYIFGGAGRHFGPIRTWFGLAGAGMEYRYNPHLGVFLDVRGVLPDKTKNSGIARLGMRFDF